MQTTSEDAERMKPVSPMASSPQNSDVLTLALTTLEDSKAEDITTIDLAGKTAIADHMIVASGRSHRHVGAIADKLARELKQQGLARARIEGQENCDWVLLDAGAIIVHIFRPEVREFYNIEKMWMADRPEDPSTDETQ